jgi:RHS repeat-associated protein
MASATNAYKVYGISYDVNGNLKTLRRNDQSGTNASRDYINYVYNTNQNTLQKTQNSVPADTRNYTYDVAGRMTSYTNSFGDVPKYVSYDYTGKVTAVYKDAAKTQALATFLYDEKGHRIRKTQYNASSPYNAVSHTYYINDMQGTVLSVYKVTVGSAAVQEEIYIYGKNRIGMLNKYGTSEYNYEIKDHLGNVRAVVRKNTTTHSVEVLSYSDYYPHGGLLPGRSLTPSMNARNNCYQGETAERDDETGYIDFDLRMYDSDIARWFVPDPMNQHFSPYLAMGNDPISSFDPTGGEEDDGGGGYGNPSNKGAGGYGDGNVGGAGSPSDGGFISTGGKTGGVGGSWAYNGGGYSYVEGDEGTSFTSSIGSFAASAVLGSNFSGENSDDPDISLPEVKPMNASNGYLYDDAALSEYVGRDVSDYSYEYKTYLSGQLRWSNNVQGLDGFADYMQIATEILASFIGGPEFELGGLFTKAAASSADDATKVVLEVAVKNADDVVEEGTSTIFRAVSQACGS